RAGGHAEHRHANCEKCQMIEADNRQNARLHDLQHQNAHADQEETHKELHLLCHQRWSPKIEAYSAVCLRLFRIYLRLNRLSARAPTQAMPIMNALRIKAAINVSPIL